jgi:hypothetical protein
MRPVSRKTYTTQIRVLLCQTCGAPLEVEPAGGFANCSYCRAQNQITGRRQAAIAPPSMPIDENERMRRLRMQDGRPLVPPPSLMPLLGGNGFHPAKVDEAMHVYQATRRELIATHSPDAGERLYFLALIANNHFGVAGDEARRRAFLETTLETAELPRHIQVMRCLLASSSAKEGDIASAEQWLQPCNPRSDDIESDSAFRVARAFVDTAGGNYQAVIGALGTVDDAYPIADTWDPTAAVLRANSLEKLGDVNGAVIALRTRMSKEGAGGRAMMQKIISAHPTLGLCAQSFAIANQGHAQMAAQSAASGAGGLIGTIFFYTGIGIIVFGVLLAAGIAVPMLLAASADPTGMSTTGSIVGAVLGGGITLFVTLLMGGIFATIGNAFRKKGQRAAWLRVNGISAQGRVHSVQPTGTVINNVPMVRVQVEVQHPHAAPYMAAFEQLYTMNIQGAIQPGATVPLRINPQQPTEIILEAS